MTAPQHVAKNYRKLKIEEFERRLDGLERLVLKQHEIIGILIDIGKRNETNRIEVGEKE